MRDISRRQAAVASLREEVEAARKALKKRLPPPPKHGQQQQQQQQAQQQQGDGGGGDGSSAGGSSSSGSEYLTPAEYVSQDEILKVGASPACTASCLPGVCRRCDSGDASGPTRLSWLQAALTVFPSCTERCCAHVAMTVQLHPSCTHPLHPPAAPTHPPLLHAPPRCG
jgi:hypothetical protein